jgi:hypothetical protein
MRKKDNLTPNPLKKRNRDVVGAVLDLWEHSIYDDEHEILLKISGLQQILACIKYHQADGLLLDNVYQQADDDYFILHFTKRQDET